MIYRSNLVAPDLQPFFKYTHSRPMSHSMGHDVMSDFADRASNDQLALYKACGFWTVDEAAILFNIAEEVGGEWLDIGAHTGWTACHIAMAGCKVTGVEPMLPVRPFCERFLENVAAVGVEVTPYPARSDEFFADVNVSDGKFFDGIVIDGDHNRPRPMQDAENAASHLAPNGVILLHDFIGRPVQEAVEYLMVIGFNVHVYWTPHMIACCWRGDFIPPVHQQDPQISWHSVRQMMPEFPFGKCV